MVMDALGTKRTTMRVVQLGAAVVIMEWAHQMKHVVGVVVALTIKIQQR